MNRFENLPDRPFPSWLFEDSEEDDDEYTVDEACREHDAYERLIASMEQDDDSTTNEQS